MKLVSMRGQHYFSMGFVEGESLAARIANGPLPPEDAARILLDVCSAVQYAHEHGVIHRDLKPANILLDEQGRPRVTDFGLAKQVDSDSHLTTTGQVVGTPSFMPPEQATGQDRRDSDQPRMCILGAVLYAMLAGRPPFQSASVADTLRQVSEQDPISIRQLNTQVPRDLETICLKCLEKEPRKRYGSVAEVAEELQCFLEGCPIKARPIGLARAPCAGVAASQS